MRKPISTAPSSGKAQPGADRPVRMLVAAVLAGAFVLAACSPASSKPDSGQPSTGETAALSGDQLIAERCTVCHNVDLITQSSSSSDQWEALVTRMISKGAQLTDAEKAVLVEYLAKTYGP